ncbi:hypothetical protein [Crenobacter luteus]|nr:hypothetical protein [Crenobacter luteus]
MRAPPASSSARAAPGMLAIPEHGARNARYNRVLFDGAPSSGGVP